MAISKSDSLVGQMFLSTIYRYKRGFVECLFSVKDVRRDLRRNTDYYIVEDVENRQRYSVSEERLLGMMNKTIRAKTRRVFQGELNYV